jgi:hypothetical protein
MINDNNDVDNETIPHISKCRETFGFSFIVFNNRVFIIDIYQKDLKLEVE